jgi:hypothetical protein
MQARLSAIIENPMSSGPDGDHAGAQRYARIKDVGEFVFAAILTVYGVLGYYLLRDQLQVMQDQTAITKQQLDDARRANAASEAETNRLLDANDKLADAAARNAESAASAAEATRALALAAQISAENSSRMLRVSETGLAHTQESLRLDQRAWVGIKDWGPPNFDFATFGEISLRISNSGRTPALDVRSRVYNQVSRSEVPPPPEDYDTNIPPGAPRNTSLMLINPGQVIEISGRALGASSKAGLEDLRQQRQFVFFRALILYKDIFGQEHTTTYCAVLQPDLRSFVLCGEGYSAN